MVEERSGAFPDEVRLYLLNKLFQLRPAEIAKLEGKQPRAVQGMIIRVSDQLRAGELSLFELDQEEAETAKARLEAKRKKRRERYARKKNRREGRIDKTS
jgi:ParB-like chromosome segregation protein Spo0J